MAARLHSSWREWPTRPSNDTAGGSRTSSATTSTSSTTSLYACWPHSRCHPSRPIASLSHPAGRHRRSDRRVCFLFLGSTSTGHLDWRSALPLIGLTAWADVRGLANSLFTPLHCSERVQDFRWINPVWINGLKSAGVRALEFPPPPDHTRTLARDVPPVHRLTTCWAPRRTSPSLIPHLSPSIRHSTPLLPFVLVAVFSHPPSAFMVCLWLRDAVCLARPATSMV